MASEEVDIVQPAPHKKGLAKTMSDFKVFCWNGETSQCMGRTGASWGKIGLFYLIFYSCLAGFFACMLAIFFLTLDDNHPKYSSYSSLLKDNPGLGFQPMPDHESTLIHFYSDRKGSYKIFTDYLQAYLLQYENEFKRPGDTSNIISCDTGRTVDSGDTESVCKFDLNRLGPCIAKRQFGYDRSQPCVMLRLNRVYGWEPANGTDVKVECHGVNPADIDNMGQLKYYPSSGDYGVFESYYFPFLSQQNYMSPLVMVEFTNPKVGVLVMVECRAHNAKIKYNKQRLQGAVKFELLVD